MGITAFVDARSDDSSPEANSEVKGVEEAPPELSTGDNAPTADGANSEAVTSSSPSFSYDSGWKKRLNPKEKQLEMLHERIKRRKVERTATFRSKFCPGCLVSSRNKAISTVLPQKKCADGKTKSVRPKIYGIVLKQSEMSPTMWLVKFYNGESMYVIERFLIFEKNKMHKQIFFQHKRKR